MTLGGDKFPKVRARLLNSIKEKFASVGVLDEFQLAGVFVNWWDNIKYDLKTIMQNGWDVGLISDEYLIEEFFTNEKTELEQIEITQTDYENQLEEAVEEALNIVEYEPDEEEGEVKQTPALAKNELKTQIEYVLTEKNKPEEAKPLQEQDTKIKNLEIRIKESRALLKQKQEELVLKIELKRYGSEDIKAESNALLLSTQKEISKLDADIEQLIQTFKTDLEDTTDYEKIKKSVTDLEKELKKTKNDAPKLSLVLEAKKQFKEITKTYNARIKDSEILQNRMKRIDMILAEIGGIITTEESQKLILKKHFDIINNQLQRYLKTEKRALIRAYENLFDKYYTSAQAIEKNREITMAELNDFLTQLSYLSRWKQIKNIFQRGGRLNKYKNLL